MTKGQYDTTPQTARKGSPTSATCAAAVGVFGLPIGWFAYAANQLLPAIGLRPSGDLMHHALLPNHKKHLAALAQRRLYLYSDTDEVATVEYVEKHIAAAKAAALNAESIQCVRFGGSGHVQHAVRYTDEYWGAIIRLWDDVVLVQCKL